MRSGPGGVRTLVRWTAVAAPVLAAALLFILGRPLIVFAYGFEDGPYFLTPVRQLSPPSQAAADEIGTATFWVRGILDYLGHIANPRPEWTMRNWTGEELYVDGRCFVCGKPWAPTGSFALVMLPTGLAWFGHDGDKEYEHMSAPNYLPSAIAWLGAGAASLVVARLTRRRSSMSGGLGQEQFAD